MNIYHQQKPLWKLTYEKLNKFSECGDRRVIAWPVLSVNNKLLCDREGVESVILCAECVAGFYHKQSCAVAAAHKICINTHARRRRWAMIKVNCHLSGSKRKSTQLALDPVRPVEAGQATSITSVKWSGKCWRLSSLSQAWSTPGYSNSFRLLSLSFESIFYASLVSWNTFMTCDFFHHGGLKAIDWILKCR